MSVLIIVAVVALLVMFVVHFWQQDKLVKTLVKLDQGRQDALFKQHKAAMQDVARVKGVTENLAEQSRRLHDEARLVHGRVDGFFADPRVQRLLDEGVSGRGG